MKQLAIFALSAALAAGAATPAAADETTSWSNVLLVEQLTDAAMVAGERGTERCRTTTDPQADVRQTVCVNEFKELDPLAKPFVHSTAASVAAAVSLNVLARSVAERDPHHAWMLKAASVLYVGVLAHNAFAFGLRF